MTDTTDTVDRDRWGGFGSRTRAQHVEWCKDRALAELDDDADGGAPQRAMASMTSDLAKHPDTAADATRGLTGAAPIGVELGMLEAMAGVGMRNADETRRWIENFR